MAITNTYFNFEDTSGSQQISFYCKSDQATIGEGETKDLIIQDAVLTTVQLVKRTLEMQVDGMNGTTLSAIIARFDEAKVALIGGTYTGFDIPLGAFSLIDVRPTNYTPTVPEQVNGVDFYTQAVSLTYSAGTFS